jgi:hypothetical protein
MIEKAQVNKKPSGAIKCVFVFTHVYNALALTFPIMCSSKSTSSASVMRPEIKLHKLETENTLQRFQKVEHLVP